MPCTTGVHHVALVTSDLDRLIAFYSSVFEAEVVLDMEEEGLRHAMLDLGGGFALHPFFLGADPGGTGGADRGGIPPMFERGHLDHVALNVVDRETFEAVRRRLVECGASDGTVTDFGMVRTVTFVDPDGWEGEVAQWQDRSPLAFRDRIREPFPELSPVPATGA